MGCSGSKPNGGGPSLPNNSAGLGKMITKEIQMLEVHMEQISGLLADFEDFDDFEDHVAHESR